MGYKGLQIRVDEQPALNPQDRESATSADDERTGMAVRSEPGLDAPAQRPFLAHPSPSPFRSPTPTDPSSRPGGGGNHPHHRSTLLQYSQQMQQVDDGEEADGELDNRRGGEPFNDYEESERRHEVPRRRKMGRDALGGAGMAEGRM